MKSSDVVANAFLPLTFVLASRDWTTEQRLLVDRCYVLLQGMDTREALVTSIQAAGDAVALEVHLSDVPVAVPLQ